MCLLFVMQLNTIGAGMVRVRHKIPAEGHGRQVFEMGNHRQSIVA